MAKQNSNTQRAPQSNGNGNGNSTAVAVRSMQTFLETRRDKLKEWAGDAVDPAELIKFALFEYSQSDALQRCSPASIYAALITAAQLGLSPSVSRGEGAIVPYKGSAQFQPMYRGLIKLARRNGPVKSIYAHVAFEGDKFLAKLGTAPEIIHEIGFKNRGNPIAVYAVARLEDDDPIYEVIGWDEVMRIREGAAKNSEAWNKWPEQMARKSAIKRLCKVLPTGEQFDKASRLDDMIEAGDVQGYRNVIDIGEVEIEQPAASPSDAKGGDAVKAKIAEQRRRAESAPPAPTPAPSTEPAATASAGLQPDHPEIFTPCVDCGTPSPNGERCEACASA